MPRRFLARLATAAAVAAALSAPPGLADVIEYPLLFGTSEAHSYDLAQFSKWTDVLQRIQADRLAGVEACEVPDSPACRVQEWQRLLADLEDKPKAEQIERVNRYWNSQSYIEDPTNYGLRDYWATPRELLARGGDCEDFAIAKYVSLRQLGFSESRLRIVVLRDLKLNLAHAVLVVYGDGKTHILDNQIKQVEEAENIRHYRPLFSINEHSWWRHERTGTSVASGTTVSPALAPSGKKSTR